mmetsp:Transcript_59469/g.174048  ORF Transcript_59469/g.174048 Transcript_59469/m.174048 type:complete len:290 (-) Transcript_59469:116-985(-)
MAPVLPRRSVEGRAPTSWDSATPELQEKLARRLQRIGDVNKSSQVVARPVEEHAADCPAGDATQGEMVDQNPDDGKCRTSCETRLPHTESEHMGSKAASVALPECRAAQLPPQAESCRAEEDVCTGIGTSERPARSRCRPMFWFMWLAVCAGVLYCLGDEDRWGLNHWMAAEAQSELELSAAELELCQQARGNDEALAGPAAQLLDARGAEGRLRCGRVLVQARRRRLQVLAQVVVFAILAAAMLCTVLILSCCQRVVGKVPAAMSGATILAVAAAAAAVCAQGMQHGS